MPLLAAQVPDVARRFRAKRDAVVNLHMIADDARLADHRACAMVDKEVRSDPRARMQIHAGPRVRPLGHNARDERDVTLVELVRDALHRDRLHERIRHDDLLSAQRRRVAVEGRVHVRLQHVADIWQATKQADGGLVGDRPEVLLRHSLRRGVFEALVDLVFQPLGDGVHQRHHLHLELGRMDHSLVEKSGEKQPQQIERDAGNDALRGQVFAVEMIDAARLGVGNNQLIGELSNRRIHGSSIGQRRLKGNCAERK